MTELVLPDNLWAIINKYKKLKLGGKDVSCPYFINTRKAKDLRAMVGKGTPEEIEFEAKIWEKLKGVNFNQMNEGEIRQFLIDRGIGVDCSGFIMHVLNEWFLLKTNKSIWGKLKIPDKNLIAKISYFFKPIQKLGAEIITNNENTSKVNLNEVIPLDLIRSKGQKQNAHHVLLITKVKKDQDKKTKEIHYINSNEKYDKQNGIREGKIIINNPDKNLELQNWIDNDDNGANHVLDGYLKNIKDNGIRRLNAIKELQEKIYK